MRNFKAGFRWLYNQIYAYNLFSPEEQEHSNEDNSNQTISEKQQKYTTWLYIVFLFVSLYVLFYMALIKPQEEPVVVLGITPTIFKNLNNKYRDTLSCPCSTITMRYDAILSHNIEFHPICSSIFISRQWIEALYLTNASRYPMADFRKTASRQFHLLSSLCSLSMDAILKAKTDVDSKELISKYIQTEIQVASEVNAVVDSLRDSVSLQLVSFLNYLHMTDVGNYLISALNTNAVFKFLVESNRIRTAAEGMNYCFEANNGAGCNMCGSVNHASAAIFVPSFHYNESHLYSSWTDPLLSSTFVDGFFIACTPFQAILRSTLDCLYNVTCIDLLTEYFPKLSQISRNWNDHILTSKQANRSVVDHLNNLFVENWNKQLNYSQYFAKCSPASCSYTTTNRRNVYHAITLLVSLYGGLIIVLRTAAHLFTNIVFKFYNWCSRSTIRFSYKIHLRTPVRSFQQLNLFSTIYQRTEEDIKRQKIITRTYLTLLCVALLVLILFNSLATQTFTITVTNPSLDMYTNLRDSHSDTLKCPCSTLQIPYKSFVTLSPTLHQICSSNFVDSRWLVILSTIEITVGLTDWRGRARSQFQLLQNICQFANTTIQDMTQRFMLQLFVTSDLLIESDFIVEMEKNFKQFFSLNNSYFNLLTETSNLLTQITLPLIGTYDVESNEMNCICMTNPHCQSPVVIRDFGDDLGFEYTFDAVYFMPGWVGRCSAIESLLFSTLECFYSDSDCYYLLMRYVEYKYERNDNEVSNFYTRPLVYHPTLTRFPPNTRITTLVENLMIEHWNRTFSYKNYYESCAPMVCTYSKKTRARNALEVILTLFSVIGGLNLSLRFITPYLISFILYLFRLVYREPTQVEAQVRVTCCSRMRQIFKRVYLELINLNIFCKRDFGHSINQEIAKRLGRWATRIYILLLIFGFVILAVYTVIKPVSITKTFPNPSLDTYDKLRSVYGDQLQCSCSFVSLVHRQFIEVQPKFHQICSSVFVSDEFRKNLVSGLGPNLFVYERKDYRRFILAHMHFLSGLCHLSRKSVNSSVGQFLSSLMVTARMLSRVSFHQRLNSRIQQLKSTAPNILSQILFLIRFTHLGNSIVSTYGTNFHYLPTEWEQKNKVIYIASESLIYDNQCSCGLSSNCTSQGYLQGLKIGCIPSESFRSSTIECFYNSSCLQYIQEYTNFTFSKTLSSTESRFSAQATIHELSDNLFIEDWNITVNYSLYYRASLLLALQGGLSIVLKIACPWIIRIVFKIYKRYQRRRNRIEPMESSRRATTEVIPSHQYSKKIIWICFLLIIITISLIVFSFFILSQSYTTSTVIVNIMNTTSVIEITVSTRAKCLLKFQQISKYQGSFYGHLQSHVMADFDYNGQLDFAYFDDDSHSIVVRFGDGAGYFDDVRESFVQLDEIVTGMIAANLNDDDQLDLVLLHDNVDLISIFIGTANGAFERLITLTTTHRTFPVYVTVAHLNNDGYLDIAVANPLNSNIGIFFGNGNMTFSAEELISTGSESWPVSLAVLFYDKDNYRDILVLNSDTQYVSLLVGDGIGNFQPRKPFFAKAGQHPSTMTIVKFDNDTRPDVVLTHDRTNKITIMSEHGNRTLGAAKNYFVQGGDRISSIAITDFDNDGYLDIGVGQSAPFGVSILFGQPDGNFHKQQTVFSSEITTAFALIVASDLDNDGYSDIIVTEEKSGTMNILLNKCN
ncbi:unnamed protein product [Adineta ricciae]|uniref:Uncharacterized protein n=1 Tax=Adineta ricciae TaxID=249248 RepID=A0A814TWF1_ADIRI|nr:unnamed protein product [Adineta ricciae]